VKAQPQLSIVGLSQELARHSEVQKQRLVLVFQNEELAATPDAVKGPHVFQNNTVSPDPRVHGLDSLEPATLAHLPGQSGHHLDLGKLRQRLSVATK
jgi:hypothetical protein